MKDDVETIVEAAERGHRQHVAELLSSGADVESEDEDGRTALILAAREGHTEVVRGLVRAGANVEAKTNRGRTALIYAASHGHVQAARLLLDAGAHVDAEGYYGGTALMKAATYAHVEVVRELLKRGANVEAKDNRGWTALTCVAFHGHLDVARLLLEAGARVNTFTVMIAVSQGHAHTVAELHRRDNPYNALLRYVAPSNRELREMLRRAGSDPLKEHDQSKLRFIDHQKETSPLPLLQNALQSVLQRSSSASEHCATLINEHNCSQSLEEWNAAHTLLVLAVRDCEVDPVHYGGRLYFWKDQLYSTVSNLGIKSDQDKNIIFACLREAHKLKLIESPDAYISSMHIMNTVQSELFVLKKAALMLLERVLCLEASVEDLRNAFQAYRERQLFSNLLGIAIKLIPVAGGALANAVLVGVDVWGDLTAANVIEYSLTAAATLLEEKNFSSLPDSRKSEVLKVLDEYEYTIADLQAKFYDNRERPGSSVGEEEEAKQAATTENNSESSSVANPTQTSFADHQIRCPEEDPPSDHNEEQEHGQLNRYKSRLEILKVAENWTAYILGSRDDNQQLHALFSECLAQFLGCESVLPQSLKSASSSDISELKDAAVQAARRELGDVWKIGYAPRLRQYVDQFYKMILEEETPTDTTDAQL